MAKSHGPKLRAVYQWQRRSPSLLVLNDQGAPARLRPEAFGITGRDRSWNSFAQNFLSANEPQLRRWRHVPPSYPIPTRSTCA